MAGTTREQITDVLREKASTPSELAAEFEITSATAIEHVEHVARSIEGTGEQLLVAPPTCRECGFDGFEDLLNRPSRCPECKSEAIEEPAFVIE